MAKRAVILPKALLVGHAHPHCGEAGEEESLAESSASTSSIIPDTTLWDISSNKINGPLQCSFQWKDLAGYLPRTKGYLPLPLPTLKRSADTPPDPSHLLKNAPEGKLIC